MKSLTTNHNDIQLLSDADLLAVLISQDGFGGLFCQEAHELPEVFDNSLNQLITIRPNLSELSPDLDSAFVKINAALELARRCMSSTRTQEKISKSADVFEQFKGLAFSHYEEFWILLLNRGNRIIDRVKISEGGVSGTVVDPKKIFHHALQALASSLILVHNHPSGNLQASDADITKRA